MIDISFKTDKLSQSDAQHCYLVAEEQVRSNQPIAVLESFQDECLDRSPQCEAAASLINHETTQLIYHGPGWLGNEWRETKCWTVKGGFKIVVAGIGSNWLTADGRSILIAPKPNVAEELIVEVALGPPLILALALRGTWCLHSSALLSNGQALLLLGESGKGKSTLARWVDANSQQTMRRIADDILPVVVDDGALHVLPHFPQLKIPTSEQPSRNMPQRLPVAAAYVITRPDTPDRVEIGKLETQEGALALVRHTVASRLFDAALMTRHFDFCARTASQIRIKELCYPLTKEALPEIFHELLLDLERRSAQ